MIQFFNKLFGVQVLAPLTEDEMVVMSQADQEAIEAWACNESTPADQDLALALGAYYRNLGRMKPHQGIHMHLMSEWTNPSKDYGEIYRARLAVKKFALEKLAG